jgi:hypothetical protein
MRGKDDRLESFFSYLRLSRIPADHPLRAIWASMKSFVPKEGSNPPPAGGGRNAERDFRGEKRSNGTHSSTISGESIFRRPKNRRL